MRHENADYTDRTRIPADRARKGGGGNALSIAQIERQEITMIASFDEDFDSVAGVQRWSGA